MLHCYILYFLGKQFFLFFFCLMFEYYSDSCQELTFLPFELMLQMSQQKYDFSVLDINTFKNI